MCSWCLIPRSIGSSWRSGAAPTVPSSRRSTARPGSEASDTTVPNPGELPERWSALPGLYRNDNPWSPALRIVSRKGGLALQWPSDIGDEGGDAALIPLADGWFAVGEERDPRRIRFLGEADGLAIVAEFNGGRWYRASEQ